MMKYRNRHVVVLCSLFAVCGLVRAGDALPLVDLSGETNRHVVVAAGTEDVYQGHPTTMMTADGRIIAVWCTPHGGWCGPAAESADGGRSWTRIDGRFPEGFKLHVNCPSIYRLVGPDGKARIWVWSQAKMPPDSKDHLDRRWRGKPMPSVMSEDEGRTWKEMPPLGKKFRCVMAFSSIVQLKDGSYLGMFHVRSDGRDAPPLGVYQAVTKDGGFTWSAPVCIALVEGKSVCEPYVFRSPKGDELCCIMRENLRTGNSMVMFSRDEGKTWTTPVDAPWGLTGDRHQGVQLPDGRLVVVFRDMAPKSPTRGHFVAWVGPYDAVKSRETKGTYRVKLLHNYATVDCGYPGIHLLPNGEIVCTTYLKYWNDKRLQSVVSTRFRIEETDRMSASPVFAEIKMGAPFTDGAVLQRGMKVPVWGRVTTSGGASVRRVKVEFAIQSKTADVGADGSWKVELDPMEASKESRVMTVSGMPSGPSGGSAATKVEVKDVLVGEVWFASGQSNMECPIWGPGTRYRDMKGGMMTTMTRLPYVRYVKPERNWSVKPVEFSARWCTFTPENLQIFHRDASFPGDPGKGVQLSAVAFYFARELYLALDVPVGIVNSSWGGTNIDAWTPRSGYEGCDESIRATAEYEVKAKWKSETDCRGPVGGPHQQPTVLYSGMVSAFAPMAMRGLIWYQGCHNSREPGLYCAKLHALYEGWRREFANDGLRIYLVQLAPYKDNWPGMCAAQNKFVSEEKNAAIAVVSDAGNFDDIHPNDKEIVAKRLVVHALKRDYGFAIPEDDSPVFRSATFGDGRATVSFDHVKDWYVYAPRHSRSPAFELAGADGKWYPAKILNYRKTKDKDGNQVATDFIDGSSIVLESEGLADPVKVRYMGRPRTSGILYNEASLPLGPFESM